MSVAASCSWCHTTNTLVPGVRNLCRHCGHRADLCRLDCDCPQCGGLFSPETPKKSIADALEKFRDVISGKEASSRKQRFKKMNQAGVVTHLKS